MREKKKKKKKRKRKKKVALLFAIDIIHDIIHHIIHDIIHAGSGVGILLNIPKLQNMCFSSAGCVFRTEYGTDG